MENQLIRAPARYLYTIYGQSYEPPRPAQPGYYRHVLEAQWVWVDATQIIRWNAVEWIIELYWVDPVTRKNESWMGRGARIHPIHVPYLARTFKGRMQIQVRGADQTRAIWVPPVPAYPGRPYIPDQHVYEDATGWMAGARSIAQIGLGKGVEWKVGTQSRGVAVGLTPHAAAGQYWTYPLGVLVVNGVASVIENGVEKQNLGVVRPETVFGIGRAAGQLVIRKDQEPVYSVADHTTAPLLMDVSFYAPGDYVFDPLIVNVQGGYGGYGEVGGKLLGLQGKALDGGASDALEDEDDGQGTITKVGLVSMQAFSLQGSAVGADGGDGSVEVTLPPLQGVAFEVDGVGIVRGTLSALRGEAAGYIDLPPLDEPSVLHAPLPSIQAADEPVSPGVEGMQATHISGLVADDDVSLAYGVLPFIYGSAVQDNPDEDTLIDYVGHSLRLSGLSMQEARMHQKVSALVGLDVQNISALQWAERAASTHALSAVAISHALFDALARLAVIYTQATPAQDGNSRTLVCHEDGGFVTEYTRYNFQSFIRLSGKYYGVASGGIYLLEGDTDDGVDITAFIDLGTKDFFTQGIKSMPAAYAAVASSAPAKLTVKSRQGEFTYQQRASSPRLQVQRFDIGRGLRDTHFDLSLEVPAKDFELAGVDFEVLKNPRRI